MESHHRLMRFAFCWLILLSPIYALSSLAELPDSVPQMVRQDSLFIYIDISDTTKTLNLISVWRDTTNGDRCSLVAETWPCSPGRSGSSTPRGNFAIMAKALDAYSSIFHVEMFYWMAFSPDGYLFGIHALPVSYDGGYLRHLGRPASHGCIRLAPEVAKYLFNRVPLGTKVIIR